MPLGLVDNVFSGNPLDRAGDRRTDPEWVASQAADPHAIAALFWKGNPLVEPHGEGLRICYVPAEMAQALVGPADALLFLGVDGLAPVFAAELEHDADPAPGILGGRAAFRDLRASAVQIPLPETGILATGRSLFSWHRRHRFCANCGQPSEVVDGGWKRRCPACQTEHFPRVDPCVIMLPTLGERCLMGRQASWPEGRFSALAGFLEPGETVEEACAREVKEESGLTVNKVRYHSSQPWPYPANLMIGLVCEVSDDQAAPDYTELEAVHWFTRAEVRDLLEDNLPGFAAPGDIAIARQLVKAWAFEQV